MQVRQEPPVAAFTLTSTQEALVHEVRQLAASELRPLAETAGPGRVNRELLRAMAGLGLLTRLFPGTAGRGGDSHTVPAAEMSLLWEALATESTGAAMALILQGLGSYPVARFGSASQAGRWLPAVASGEAVAALAVAEPGVPAGSREPEVRLTARPDHDGWRLTGEKTWVFNAPEADFYTVLARLARGPRGSGVSAFLVPAVRPGLSGERLDIAGGHPVGCLSFDGVPVAADDLIGGPGQGLRIAAVTSAAFRPSAAAFAVGIARAALDMAVAHTGANVSSGAPAGRRSVIQLLAQMAARTEAARLLVRAAAAGGGTTRARSLAAMAELEAAEAAQFVVDGAMEVTGADALRSGHRLEQLSREVRAIRLYAGPPDLLYELITAELSS